MVNEHDIPHETMNAQASPVSPQHAEPVVKKTDYWGYIVLAAGVGALISGLVSAVGTGWGFWEYTSGLKGVAGAFLLGLGAILIGAVQGWRTRKAINPPPRARRWVGMGVALLYVGWVGTFLMAALTVPAFDGFGRPAGISDFGFAHRQSRQYSRR